MYHLTRKAFILFASALAVRLESSLAFAPIKTTSSLPALVGGGVSTPTTTATTAPTTASSLLPTSFAKTTTPFTTTTTALSAAYSADPDLVVGFGIICAAVTPYVLAIPFKDFFNKNMFVPVYEDDELGRLAEIGWKVRYATLGLALTILAFSEVYIMDVPDPVKILKDSYVLWAIFYTDATLKIYREANSDPLIFRSGELKDRLFTQGWHLFVVLVLWADVSETYTGNAITNFIKGVFT